MTADVFLTRSESQNCYFIRLVTAVWWWWWLWGWFDERGEEKLLSTTKMKRRDREWGSSDQSVMYWLSVKLCLMFSPKVLKSNQQVVWGLSIYNNHSLRTDASVFFCRISSYSLTHLLFTHSLTYLWWLNKIDLSGDLTRFDFLLFWLAGGLSSGASWIS